MSARVDPIKCPLCLSTKLFKSPSKLYIHLREHTSERPLRCPQSNCGKRFRIKSDLKAHAMSHLQSPKKMSTINNVPSTSKSVVKLGGTKSNNRPSTSSDQGSTDSRDNESWKTPKIGTISPTPKPTGTGLNFFPNSVWFQCQICKVLMEHEAKFLIHKRTRHRLPKRKSSISPPVESDAESDKSVQIIAVVSKDTKKVPFVNLDEEDEPLPSPPEKKPFVANL